MAKAYSKNKWALFLLLLVGIVMGSFIGYICQDLKFLSWLNYGFEFSIGDKQSNYIVSLNLGALILHFGISLKITVGSIIGVIAAIILYKKL